MEFFHKNDALGDPYGHRGAHHGVRQGDAPGPRRHLALTLQVNDFLFGLFLGCGIKLIDFKVEFGRLCEDDMVRIVLADEISPDPCRLWDLPGTTRRWTRTVPAK